MSLRVKISLAIQVMYASFELLIVNVGDFEDYLLQVFTVAVQF